MRLGFLALMAVTTTGFAAPYVAYTSGVPVHSYSPDARMVVVDLATGASVVVSEGLYSARSASWAPDGSVLAFEAESDGQQDIFLCRPDGSERVNVTATTDEWETSPVVLSADRVAYLSGPDRSVVSVKGISAGQTRTLLDQPRFYRGLAAAPDGSMLAVVGSDQLAGPGHIYLAPTDDAAARQLTTEPGLYSSPCFTADGKALLYAFDGPNIGGCTRGLARMALEGEPELLAEQGYPFAPVCASQSGDTIAYVACPQYHTTWVNIIRDGKTERIAVSPFHNTGWPSLSADGKLLAYHGVQAAQFTVHVLDLTTGQDRSLSPGSTGVCPVISSR